MRVLLTTLSVALLGGLLFKLAGGPLPWTIGPLLACAAANLAGWGLRTPVAARNFGQWMVGTVLGLYFTPAVVDRVLTLGPWILLGTVWAILLGLAFAWSLKRFAGASWPTAFFGGAIGGASEMALQGELAGGRVDQIAASHSLRIVLVVVTLPLLYRWLGLQGSDPYQAASLAVDPVGAAWLVAATVPAALVLRVFGGPNAWLLGPMVASTALTASGHHWSALPQPLIVAGQVAIGASLGCRFVPEFFAQAPRFLSVVLLTTLAGIGATALFAIGLGTLAGIAPATMVLATAPGGIAEMALTAQNLQLGVPVVTAFHVVRMVATMTLMGGLYRVLSRLNPALR